MTYRFVLLFSTILLAGTALPALAAPPDQDNARVDMKQFHQLEERADEVVEVNLEGKLLEQGRKLLSARKHVTSAAKDVASRVKGVYLRVFRFGRNKGYSDDDIRPIREQLAGPGWVPMFDVNGKGATETVTVYSFVEDEQVGGVAVVSADKEEVTVVNIVGDIDLSALGEIGRELGIPTMNVATKDLPKD